MSNSINNKGFSLLEIIVVMFIISIGMIGISSLVSANIYAGVFVKNKLIAMNLSQEGIELVRNIRDENWLDGKNWKDGIINDGTYIIDYRGKSSIDDTVDNIDDNSAKLYIDTNGFYQHDSTIKDTVFSRLITIHNETSTSTEVNCEVKWKRGNKSISYNIDTILTNWRD